MPKFIKCEIGKFVDFCPGCKSKIINPTDLKKIALDNQGNSEKARENWKIRE